MKFSRPILPHVSSLLQKIGGKDSMFRKQPVRFLSLLIAGFITILITANCSILQHKTEIETRHNITTSTSGRIPAGMSLLSSKKVMVVLAFGQSNSANFGETKYRPQHESYSYYRGKLYRAEDPLPGADGDRGSVWTRLADMVIESGMYEKVVLVTIGIGATSAGCWAEGECGRYLEETLRDLAAHNIRFTHILWHQGEQDNLQCTGHAEYTAQMNRLLALIRGYGQDAPMYVSLASYQPHNFSRSFVSEEVRQGQADFINTNSGVLLGPDTDTLVSNRDRYDGVHFSDEGLDLFAGLWFNALKENSEIVKVRK